MTQSPDIPPIRILLFAFCCGTIVANLYYAQPIIDIIAPDVGLPRDTASLIVSLTQVGYALGLFFVVPLADIVENRRLLVATTLACMACLGAATLVHGAIAFLVVSFLVGVTSVAVQILVPLAAHLAPEESRGRVVGSVMSGLMIGILLSRPVSSFLCDHLGWRAVFAAAALLMLAMAGIFAWMMPTRRPVHSASYGQLIRSLGALFARFPVLRQRALLQGCMFATFSLLWTAAPLELSRRHGLTQSQIALFALIGAMGVIAAPIGGRLADAGHARAGTFAALLFAGLSWLPGLAWSDSLLVLAGTAVFVDFCVQMNMTISQREIFALDPASRARMNALYMTSLFVGGAVGSSLASVLYARGGWPWVAAAGSAFPALMLARYVLARPAERIAAAPGHP